MSDRHLAVFQKWKPRPASPELKQRIFGCHREEQTALPARDFQAGYPGDLARWAVPALGCLLLATAVLSGHLQTERSVRLASTNVLTEDWYSMTGGHSGVNKVSPGNFDWSESRGSELSAPGAVLLAYTNQLIGK